MGTVPGAFERRGDTPKRGDSESLDLQYTGGIPLADKEKEPKTEESQKAEKPSKEEKKGKDGHKKDEKAGKAEVVEKKEPTKAIIKHENANFKYIVRIVNTDLDGEKTVIIAIQGVKGVGNRVADIIVKKVGVARNEKIGNVSDEKIEEMENLISTYADFAPAWAINRQNDLETGDDMHVVGIDQDVMLKDDINRMKMIKTYRGVRHETGQKVRGQRTRSNGRTGLTLGVMRQRLQQGGGSEDKGDKGEKKSAPSAAQSAAAAAPKEAKK
jgi:small subunit ribosomal protein S13